jgi:hypothetical protein
MLLLSAVLLSVRGRTHMLQYHRMMSFRGACNGLCQCHDMSWPQAVMLASCVQQEVSHTQFNIRT